MQQLNLNEMSAEIHKDNHVWWHDKNGNKIERNRGELICLMHSELSEAMEGERKGLFDDKLPKRLMAEVEMADCIIRILDYCGAFGYDIDGAIREKRAYNKTRADHTYLSRMLDGGKKW